MQFNKVIIIGHLGADPETRDVGTTKVARLRIAIDDSYKSKAGDKVDRTIWTDVEAWDKTADLCAQYLVKGSAVMVEGKLQMDEWEDKETGDKRSKLKIRADRVVFLGRPGAGGNGGCGAVERKSGGQGARPAVNTDDENIPF